jgi:hypothetical protein
VVAGTLRMAPPEPPIGVDGTPESKPNGVSGVDNRPPRDEIPSSRGSDRDPRRKPRCATEASAKIGVGFRRTPSPGSAGVQSPVAETMARRASALLNEPSEITHVGQRSWRSIPTPYIRSAQLRPAGPGRSLRTEGHMFESCRAVGQAGACFSGSFKTKHWDSPNPATGHPPRSLSGWHWTVSPPPNRSSG